ncbi:MFS general substrate transporter [Stereum hirsutum FP-91666 SS1]|uniref:MFS general substrate transporter n=1 Tax=Stereum hirsutum (strain FP-91666) TaxID=721885 RepID=UPI0004449823|nr:MFS general substrate transporter [Stereum hirsutum FP-91666 SS1]EIM82299.1 MFS general substrate transporter [Stereum hirsutum FP-91666 SS1]
MESFDYADVGSSSTVALPRQQSKLGVDGGVRAWRTTAGGWLVLLATFGYSNSFGVYQDFYTRNGDASSSRISWIGSVQIFFLIATGIVSGKLLDAGHFKTTNIVGTVLYVFSLMMVSIAHHEKYYQIFLSQGLGMGIGAGLLYSPAVAVQAHHWRKHRSLAIGIAFSGAALGGVIFPIMLNRLFHGSVGFRWGVRASGFLVLALLIPGIFLMTTNPLMDGTNKPKPEMIGILTDVPYLAACIGGLFNLLGIFFPLFYLQIFSILHGVDPNTAFYTIAILNASSVVGRIITGFAADKIGPMNAIIPVSLVNGVLLIALLGITNTGTIIIFSIIFGITSGSFMALCGPVVGSFARDESEIG